MRRFFRQVASPRVISSTVFAERACCPQSAFVGHSLSTSETTTPSFHAKNRMRRYRNYATESEVPTITKQQLEEKLDLKKKEKNHFYLIDVRQPQELQSTGAIDTAINIPCKLSAFLIRSPTPSRISVQELPMALQLDDEDWEDKFGMRKPAPEDEIICYCKIGGRSHAAVLYLQQSGFKKVCLPPPTVGVTKRKKKDEGLGCLAIETANRTRTSICKAQRERRCR